jgi:hypothetical protein
MIMRNIFLLLLMAFCAELCPAQNYYTDKSEVTANGIIYKVTDMGKYVFSLHNISNTLGDETETYYKDGRKLEYENYYKIRTKPLAGTMAKAFTETFTKAEYNELRKIKDALMIIHFFINPDGTIIELRFTLDKEPEMLSIPPSKFALLEKNLKKYVTFELSDFAKGLKNIYRPNNINFSTMNLVYP